MKSLTRFAAVAFAAVILGAGQQVFAGEPGISPTEVTLGM